MTKSTSKDRTKTAPAAREQVSSANKRPAHDESKRPEAEGAKATRFDGDPNPVGASRSAFKPQDDTPAVLDKKRGPRTGRA